MYESCKHCRSSQSLSSSQFLCTKCLSDIFPFNHYTDNNEYLWSLYSFYKLNHNLDIDRIQSLRVNPFELNNMEQNDLLDIISDDNVQYPSCGTSSYIFPEDFHEKFKSCQDYFSVMHLNSRSLCKNFDNMQILLSSLKHNFDIIGITETWFNCNTHLELYNMENYSLVQVCRSDKVGGGVAMYVKNGIDYAIRNDLSFCSPELEVLFIEVKGLKNKSTIFGCVYRPPNTNILSFNDKLNSCLCLLEKEKKDIFLLGDYNIDLLHHQSHNNTTVFLETMFSHNMYPLISKPTRITSRSCTLIDNIFMNAVFENVETGLIYTDVSDHLPIFCLVKVNRSVQQHAANNVKKRVITDKKIHEFRKRLAETDWSAIYTNDDTNASYNHFIKTFAMLYNDCFPFIKQTKVKCKPKKPWISIGLLTSIKKKNNLYIAYLRKPSDKSRIKYTLYKNKLTTLIRNSKKQYFYDLFQKCKGNMKKTWNNINDVLGKKKQNVIPNEMYLGSDKYSSRETIVQEFNSYFANIGKKLSDSIPHVPNVFKKYLSSDYVNSLFLKPISVYELTKLCKSLDPSKACGSDDISPRVVKKTIFYFVDPLCNISNKSISTGIFPDSLKVAKVVPLYKKKCKQNIDNYRPVAILSVFSKLLEKVMYSRLFSFFEKYEILINEQFGFRKNHSTAHGVLNLTNYVTNELDKGNFCLGLFMDLSKAFDTIDHHILLDKLCYYGVRGVALDWFRSYLSGRKQYVVVDGVNSELRDLVCGVPQGSVLGPLLFLIYVNDIINSSELFRFSLFADDTATVLSHKNVHTLISLANQELTKIVSWFQNNKLHLNYEKTKFILFRSKKKTTTEGFL